MREKLEISTVAAFARTARCLQLVYDFESLILLHRFYSLFRTNILQDKLCQYGNR